MNNFKFNLLKKYGNDLGLFLSFLIEKSDSNLVECEKNEIFHELAFNSKEISQVEKKGISENLFSISKKNTKTLYKLNFINILFNLSNMGNDRNERN